MKFNNCSSAKLRKTACIVELCNGKEKYICYVMLNESFKEDEKFHVKKKKNYHVH
jgi:hypothetical protein